MPDKTLILCSPMDRDTVLGLISEYKLENIEVSDPDKFPGKPNDYAHEVSQALNEYSGVVVLVTEGAITNPHSLRAMCVFAEMASKKGAFYVHQSLKSRLEAALGHTISGYTAYVVSNNSLLSLFRAAFIP